MNAIQFENIGKLYQLGSVGTGTLSHDLNRWWQMRVLRRPDPFLKIGQTNDRTTRGTSSVVWALKDITFDVPEGDVVGIIGKNGAGKSTLLKLLSRVTAPSTGVIRARGRIASLLEVGTGFHPEMTGRENIYMNGSIMGMTKAEITSKLDEIVDFAGVERYLDTPTKRYSSGMMVRLGFAVAAFLEPEILVVDEVLAVGDAEFQKKAIGKMQDVASGSGRTVLFVSHNMGAVRNLCKRGIVLENGQLAYDGDVASAIDFYIRDAAKSTAEGKIVDGITFCKSWLHIDKIEVNGSEINDVTVVSGQKELCVRVEGRTDMEAHTDLKVLIRNRDGVIMAALAEAHYKGADMIPLKTGPFVIERHIILPRYMGDGEYMLDVCLHHPNIEWQMKAMNCCSMHVQGYFEGFGRGVVMSEEGVIGLESRELTGC